MNPVLQLSARVRAWVYGVYATVSLVVGATQAGYAAVDLTSPDWLKAALGALAFVGAGIGYTAATHTPATDVEVERAPEHRAGA